MISFDQSVQHEIVSFGTVDDYASDALPICISDTGQYQIRNITLPYVILYEECRECDSAYVVHMLSEHGAHSIRTEKELLGLHKRHPLHKHSCIEIMYVLSGSLTNYVEKQTYTYEAGQFCIMNKNICHAEEFSGDFEAVFFMLRDDYLQELCDEFHRRVPSVIENDFPDSVYQLYEDGQNEKHRFAKAYLDCFPLSPAENTVQMMNHVVEFIIQETQKPQAGSSFFIKGAFAQLLGLIGNREKYSVTQIRSDYENQEFLYHKVAHIMRTHHGRITRDELSAQLHYNGEYLNRIVKKFTGKTILEYGRAIYMEEAKTMLSETDKSVSSIIEELGFSNRHHFYQLFRKVYGKTPTEFRSSS